MLIHCRLDCYFVFFSCKSWKNVSCFDLVVSKESLCREWNVMESCLRHNCSFGSSLQSFQSFLIVWCNTENPHHILNQQNGDHHAILLKQMHLRNSPKMWANRYFGWFYLSMLQEKKSVLLDWKQRQEFAIIQHNTWPKMVCSSILLGELIRCLQLFFRVFSLLDLFLPLCAHYFSLFLELLYLLYI